MAVKVGDTVRFLNTPGGGRVTRIADGLAYVDDDGFETPVLIHDCVVVGDAPVFGNPSAPAKSKEAPAAKSAPAAPAHKVRTSEPTQLPVVETAGGDVLNIVIGFEPLDIKSLSQSDFDAYVVNDSNYYLFVSIATRSRDSREWQHRYDGVIEPNIQEYAFTLGQADLPSFDRLSVQYTAFKRDRDYEAKAPGDVDIRVDATKFAKLHCFRPNPYFDGPVIAFDISVDDRVQTDSIPAIDARALEQGMKEKRRDLSSQQHAAPRQSKPSHRADSPIVVDLHASELLDTTAGLSPADILNMQIDRFSEVMNAHLRAPGTKIVFIHGKGEGVLRQALMKELNHRYKGHDVQDASFREYGFGATQVTIRPVQAPDTPAPVQPKKRKQRR